MAGAPRWGLGAARAAMKQGVSGRAKLLKMCGEMCRTELPFVGSRETKLSSALLEGGASSMVSRFGPDLEPKASKGTDGFPPIKTSQ